jgi:hypothetical protein
VILDTAISEVQQICGWRSDKAVQIQNAITFAQTEREKPNRTFPWFLRKTNDTAIVTVFNQQNYPLPSDYIQDTDELEGNLYIYTQSSQGASPGPPPHAPGVNNSRVIFLKKQPYEYAQKRYFGEWPYVYYNPSGVLYDTGSEIGPGAPRDYVLRDSDLILYPPPDGVYYISWRYWAQDATPTLGQENKWLKFAPWVLIGDAAAKISADLGYQQGMQTAAMISQGAGQNLFHATINRLEAGRRRSLGSRL